MAKWFDTNSWLYRKRYHIGYFLVIAAFVWLLIIAGTQVPNGLSPGERNAFVTSAGLDLQNVDTLAETSLPFYVLQRVVVDILGPSTLSIKLLSLVLALVTGIGAVFLLRRWFKPNVALLATIIMVTTGQFLYVAQAGLSSITFVMWSVWLLLTATMITTSDRHKRIWKILFFLLVPLSLYTPLSIYLVLAIISAGLLHPHVRYVLRKMSKPHLVLFIIMSLVIVAPLGYLIIKNPGLMPELLGMPKTWPPDIMQNGNQLLQQYFNFIHPQSGTLMTPVLGLGSIALIALGAWRLFKIRYTARSYTLVTWVVLLIPILLINPIYTTITFVPLLILMAHGLDFLLRSWYGMFPRNPYARFVGLVPLAILVAGLTVSGIDRYYYGYKYDPSSASNFSRDLTLLETQVRVDDRPITLVTTPDEVAFYTAVANTSKASEGTLTVTTLPINTSQRLVATHAAKSKITRNIETIITSASSKDADRFYVYKTK